MLKTIKSSQRVRLIEVLTNYKVQLEQVSYQKCEIERSRKPNTKSLRKNDRDMKARDNLRRKRLREERDYEAI